MNVNSEFLSPEFIQKVKDGFVHKEDCKEAKIYRMFPSSAEGFEELRDKLFFRCDCGGSAIFNVELKDKSVNAKTKE